MPMRLLVQIWQWESKQCEWWLLQIDRLFCYTLVFQQIITCRTKCNMWLRLGLNIKGGFIPISDLCGKCLAWSLAQACHKVFVGSIPNRFESALSTEKFSKRSFSLRHLDNVRSPQHCPTMATTYRCPLATMYQYLSSVQGRGSAENRILCSWIVTNLSFEQYKGILDSPHRHVQALIRCWKPWLMPSRAILWLVGSYW